MEIIALGTGTSQGIPLIGCNCNTCSSSDPRDKRLRSSIHVRSEKVNIQVDVGPDLRQQYLVNRLSQIDHVLFTHEHNDHVIGLDDLRAVNFLQRKTLPLYAEERVAGEIIKRFHYAFTENKYPGAPDVSMNIINHDSIFQWEDIKVQAIRITHGNLPILGFRFNDVAYITDASRIDDAEMHKLKDLDVLIINALREKPHHSHLTLEEALHYIERIGARQSYLTHISHAMGPTESWEHKLPESVYPLQDNFVLKV